MTKTILAKCITCPVCGRTSFNPQDAFNGWCSNCKRETAPVGWHPHNVTIRVAAERMRTIVGDETDTTAIFLARVATLLEICSHKDVQPDTVGHVAALDTALAFLAATRHLEKTANTAVMSTDRSCRARSSSRSVAAGSE